MEWADSRDAFWGWSRSPRVDYGTHRRERPEDDRARRNADLTLPRVGRVMRRVLHAHARGARRAVRGQRHAQDGDKKLSRGVRIGGEVLSCPHPHPRTAGPHPHHRGAQHVARGGPAPLHHAMRRERLGFRRIVEKRHGPTSDLWEGNVHARLQTWTGALASDSPPRALTRQHHRGVHFHNTRSCVRQQRGALYCSREMPQQGFHRREVLQTRE